MRCFEKPRVVTHVKRLQIASTDLSVDPRSGKVILSDEQNGHAA